ncbi:MAG: RNA-binding protein, partial [Halobacteria archaeon]
VPAKKFGLGEDFPLPLRDLPIAVTAVILNGAIILDPNLDEEHIAAGKLTVISNSRGDLAGMQKSGSAMLNSEQVLRIVELACKKAQEIRSKYLEG